MSLSVERTTEQQLVRILKALADETRLKIVQKLAAGEVACNALNCDFNLTGATMSHHLKILQDCGLIERRKEGQASYNKLNAKLFKSFQKELSGFVKPGK